MVRALRGRWRALGRHRAGRWACLALELLWYAALLLALYETWDAPEAWFSYIRL